MHFNVHRKNWLMETIEGTFGKEQNFLGIESRVKKQMKN